MTIIVEIFPQCDFCLETYPDSKHKSKTLLRRDMRAGHWPWRCVDGKDMCPDCVQDRENKGKE